ncbi:HAD family hydrolase [bacterium]|nr:HAD family hydrolase [bacterium]
MKKKGLIFDFDGVIYCSTKASMEKVIKNAIIAVGEKKAPNMKLVKSFWGQSIYHMAESFSVYKRWNALDKKRFLEAHLNDDSPLEIDRIKQKEIIEMLYMFKDKGKNLYIVSNRQKKSLTVVAKDIDLDLSIFKEIVFGDTVKKNGRFITKPDPLVLCPILLTKDKEESKPITDFVLIGDSANYDFMLATRTNIDFVGVASLLHDSEEWKYYFLKHKLPNKKHLIENILDLKLIIE